MMAMEAKRLDRRYTVDDYMLWEGDWELHDGVPVQLHPPHPEQMAGFRQGMVMSPSPIAPHQIVIANMVRLLGNALEANDSCNCIVVSELDWHVNQFSTVRPDISVLCPAPSTPYIQQKPSLIVEALSPSTADRDLDWKRRLYESQGVGIYLIVDAGRRSIEVLELSGGRYVKGLPDFELHPGCRIALDTLKCWRGLPPR